MPTHKKTGGKVILATERLLIAIILLGVLIALGAYIVHMYIGSYRSLGPAIEVISAKAMITRSGLYVEVHIMPTTKTVVYYIDVVLSDGTVIRLGDGINEDINLPKIVDREYVIGGYEYIDPASISPGPAAIVVRYNDTSVAVPVTIVEATG